MKAIDNEFNNQILGDFEPISTEQKLLLENSAKKFRKEAVVLISKFEYRHALMKCKDLILVSKKLFLNTPFRYFYSFLTDSLLLAKCFIREDKFAQAEEVLTQGWKIFNKYITDENYRITKVIFEEQEHSDVESLQNYINTTGDLENDTELTKEQERIKNNLTIIKELKRRTSLLACFASLFYNVGQLKTAEDIYITYIQIIEQNYGLTSLETSNCYYLVGLFYLENNYLKKAMACMKKALEIRIGQVGANHSSISDCYYNIGLIFYIIGNKAKAHSWILNSLSIRIENTGEENIYVAKIYEMLAQMSLDDRDLKSAFDKLKRSLLIKNKIYTDPNHPDISRTLSQMNDLSARLGLGAFNALSDGAQLTPKEQPLAVNRPLPPKPKRTTTMTGTDNSPGHLNRPPQSISPNQPHFNIPQIPVQAESLAGGSPGLPYQNNPALQSSNFTHGAQGPNPSLNLNQRPSLPAQSAQNNLSSGMPPKVPPIRTNTAGPDISSFKGQNQSQSMPSAGLPSPGLPNQNQGSIQSGQNSNEANTNRSNKSNTPLNQSALASNPIHGIYGSQFKRKLTQGSEHNSRDVNVPGLPGIGSSGGAKGPMSERSQQQSDTAGGLAPLPGLRSREGSNHSFGGSFLRGRQDSNQSPRIPPGSKGSSSDQGKPNQERPAGNTLNVPTSKIGQGTGASQTSSKDSNEQEKPVQDTQQAQPPSQNPSHFSPGSLNPLLKNVQEIPENAMSEDESSIDDRSKRHSMIDPNNPASRKVSPTQAVNPPQAINPGSKPPALAPLVVPSNNAADSDNSNDSSDEVSAAIKSQLAQNQSLDSEEEEERLNNQKPPLTIIEDLEFKESLTGIQRGHLMILKSRVDENDAVQDDYNPMSDIVNSEFFNSLTPRKRDRFRLLNRHIFK